MAGEEKAENIQRELFRNLSGDITDEELNKIKQELKQKALGGFKAGEIQRELKTTDDILDKLKRRGLIKIGDYGILRKLFAAIGSKQLLDHIDEAENSLIAIHWRVKGPELDAPQRVPMPETMVYNTHGMTYPQQHPHPGGMTNPSAYSNPPMYSYQDSPMGPPQQPAPRAQPRAQYHYQERGMQVRPQMAPPNPQQHSQYLYQDGQRGAAQQPVFPEYSTSNADVQQRGGSMSTHDDDVFLSHNNIPFDNRIEYKPGRGYVLFINNFFTGKSDQRHGAEVDEKHVQELFKTVLEDFFLQYTKDVSKVELQGYLDGLKKTLASGLYQSFIFILGTHGEPRRDGDRGPSEDAVLMTGGEWMLVKDIVSSFYGDEIPAMKDKPKVFIIQSCRGKELQRSVSLSDGPATVSNPETADFRMPALTTRPVNSDVLIAYATSKGTKAWRNLEEGSWFVKELCDVISQYYNKEHILDILVRVNNRMVWRVSTEGGAKQMSCFTCTFTKRFMLVPSTR